MSKKFLILGANGLLGNQFVKQCKEKEIEYIGTRHARSDNEYRTADFQQPETLKDLLNDVEPSVVVNCVNMNGGVNAVENNPDKAHRIHVESTGVLTDWCKSKDVPFVFFSTDYVFDGANPPYKEDDPTGPLNMYGKLKLEAEQYIRATLEKYLIVRTTNVFGWDPTTPTPNFLMYLYQTLGEGKEFNTPSFLWGNPTYAEDLVKAVMELLEKEVFGLYHIVGDGYIDRYSWAVKFCEMAGLDKSKLIEIKNPSPNMVPRPLLSHLDTGKVKALIKTKLHGVDEGLQRLVEEMKQG